MGTFWLTVILPVMGGSLCIAFMNILKRYLLRDKKVSVLQFMIIGYGLIALLSGTFYVARWGFTIPATLLPGFWTAVFCGAGANFVIQFLNAKAASLDKGEVSLTAPLQAMTPGLITLLALTLGEFPGKAGVVGVCLMIMGSYVLLWDRAPTYWWEYFGPLKRLRLLFRLQHLTPAERNKTLVVSMALGSAAMGTVGLLFDGLYTRRSINFQGLVLAITGLIGSLAVGYAVWYAVKPDANSEQMAYVRGLLGNQKFLGLLVGFAVVWALHWFLIQPIFNRAFVAYVGTLKRFHILIAVILGRVLFGEGEFKKRMWAAVLIVIGAIFISMDDLPVRLSTRIEGWGL